MTSRWLLVFVLAWLGTVPLAAQTDTLEGTYSVTGTTPDGMPYTGVATFTQRGAVWDIAWDMNPPAKGVGLLEGDALSVAFFTLREELGVSRCAVRRTDGLTLQCTWTVYGADVTATETLTKVSTTTRLPKPPAASPQAPQPPRAPQGRQAAQ